MTDEEFKQHVENLMKDQVFSYSRLKLFEGCPFRWYLKYVENHEEGDSMPLMLGKAVHKAIEEKLLGKSDKEALLQGWKEVDYYAIDLVEYETLFQRANVVRGDALRPNTEVEKHFTLPLNGEGSPKLQGFIDMVQQVFGTYSFTDWKSNRLKYEPMDNMQLALYAWALSIIYNVPQVTGTLFFLRFFKDNVKSQLFTKVEMEEARSWALDLANEIQANLEKHFLQHMPLEECFPAKGNPGCSNCPFAIRCAIQYPNILKSEGVFVL